MPRKLGDLEPDRRARLTKYIARNIDVPARELAEDLQLAVSSVITAKGNITRKRQQATAQAMRPILSI